MDHLRNGQHSSEGLPILHGPPTEEEIRAEREAESILAEHKEESAHKRRELALAESSIRYSRSNTRISYLLAVFTGVAALSTAYQSYESHRSAQATLVAATAAQSSADTALQTLNEMQNGAGAHDADTVAHESVRQSEASASLAREAARQADRLAESVRATKEAAEIARNGMAAEIVVPEKGSFWKVSDKMVEIQSQNVGRTTSGPVEAVFYEGAFKFIPDKNGDVTVALASPVEIHRSSFRTAGLAPGGAVYTSIATPQIDSEPAKAGHLAFFIVGSLAYNDGFPKTPNKTFRYCIWIDKVPTGGEFDVHNCDPTEHLATFERLEASNR